MVAQHRLQVRVVGPGHHLGAGGQLLEISGEGLLDVGQVPVEVQVLPVQVGDHGGLGAKIGEGAVAFVGLGHEVVAPAQDGVGAEIIADGAHHHGGVEAAGPEDGGGHGGGGGLAVGPGDGDLPVALHQLGQHLPPAQHGEPLGPGRGQFRVVFLHRGGVDHDVGRAQVFGAVALEEFQAQALQTAGDGSGRQVRAADLKAAPHQELRQAAHADAADADEVVMFIACTPIIVKVMVGSAHPTFSTIGREPLLIAWG